MRTVCFALFLCAAPAFSLDSLINSYFARNHVDAPKPVADAVFARRAYLDLWGLPPSPEQLQEFVADTAPDKRGRLVDTLLANHRNYAEHWITFWNDLLRNDEGVVYYGTRESITTWLLSALEKDMPYDQMVRSLLEPNAPGDPKGYLIGVNWRGDVSASQVPAMQAAQNSAQVFLGVNLKCNSCHDSFISKWKLKDAYGLASYFSKEEMDVYRCDVRTGEKAQKKFLYPDAAADRSISELFTASQNHRFARTLVNRVWDRMFGRGLVASVDDMDKPAWDPELLQSLADDFVTNGYDIQRLLRQIMTSRAYQLPSVQPKQGETYVFQGPQPRRLTAEQFTDGVSAITGEWRVRTSKIAGPGMYSREWRMKSSMLSRAMGRPIRDQVFTTRNSEATTLQALEEVNGETITDLLHRGALRLQGKLSTPPPNRFDSGVVGSAVVTVDADISGATELRLLFEDADAYDPSRTIAGLADAVLEGPEGTVKLSEMKTTAPVQARKIQFKGEQPADALVAPLGTEALYDIRGRGFTRLRGRVGIDQSSQINEIGPKVRLFVFTQQPDRHNLAGVRGTPPVAPMAKADVEHLYLYAFGRRPTPQEAGIAKTMQLEDLLWALFLSPEYQYIL